MIIPIIIVVDRMSIALAFSCPVACSTTPPDAGECFVFKPRSAALTHGETMFDFNIVEAAKKRAEEARKAALAPRAPAAPTAPAAQSSAPAAPATPNWAEVDRQLEASMEHAGISGVDVQVDDTGYATISGYVNSEEDRDTVASLVESFAITGVEINLQIVAPEPVEEAPAIVEATKYTVKKGESWWGIAQRVYGNGKLFEALKAHNGNPRMLHPGAVIELPPKDKLVVA